MCFTRGWLWVLRAIYGALGRTSPLAVDLLSVRRGALSRYGKRLSASVVRWLSNESHCWAEVSVRV